MTTIEKKLQKLDITLPKASIPSGSYVPYIEKSGLIYISGQTCRMDSVMVVTGQVGKDCTVDEGAYAAKLCGLNILAQLKAACNGDLQKVESCIKLNIFVNAAVGFTSHPIVANGVSDLMINIFGELGKHVRAAVGCSSLPGNSAVEVEAIFSLR